MKKSLLFLITAACLAFFFSCSNGTFMNYMNYEPPKAAQQSGQDDGGFEDDSDSGGSVKLAAAFKYILPNGEIDPSCPADAAALKAKFAPSQGIIPSAAYESKLFKIVEIDNSNLPDMRFVDAARVWSPSDAARNESSYAGDSFKSKGQNTTDIVFYRYAGKNPFFSPTSVYNTVAFKKADGSLESVIERFKFYRWKGTGGGVVKLDNYMVALDTYTGLIFPFVKIATWSSMLGNEVPTSYAPVEKYNGADGRSHKFYEYDPSGYVDANGRVVFEPWYLAVVPKDLGSQLAAAAPVTGKSPYYNDGSDEIDGLVRETGGYPVSGTLTVTAKYFKNIDMTGTVSLVIFKNDDARFDWQIGAAAYAGSEADAPETTMLVSEINIQRKKNTQSNYAVSGQFGFTNEERALRLDLDAHIKRVNGDALPIAALKKDGGIPYTLIYNRTSRSWEHPSGFKLGVGQTKDFLITHSTADGSVQLCYTLSWESGLPASSRGKIVLPFVSAINADPQFSISGEGSEYTIEYTDGDIDSASQEKNVRFDLLLNNLDAASALSVSAAVAGTDGFIKNVKLDGASLARRGGIHGAAAIPVTLTLGCDPWTVQNAELKLTITYPASGYDKTYSVKQITFSLKRLNP